MNRTTNTLQHPFMNTLRPLLNALPGEHFEGILTADTPEWRAELEIDNYVDDESVEHTISLVFQLVVNPAGQLEPTLSLDHWMQEVGVNDSQPFPFHAPGQWEVLFEQWMQLLGQWVPDWELPESAVQMSIPFLSQVAAVATSLRHNGQ